ncbi:MAG: prepilin-type processing-associated H-X9-DG protein, partial [Planctomycetaceae bacterium]
NPNYSAEFGNVSWLTMLLPYVDQTPLYETIDFEAQTPTNRQAIINTPQNIPARRTVISGFLCPSNPQRAVVSNQGAGGDGWNDGLDGGRTDYVGNMGWMNPGHRDCPQAPRVGNWNGAQWADVQEMNQKLGNCNGVIGWQGCIRLEDIIDGTTNTVAVFENHHWTEKENPTAVQGDALWMAAWSVQSLKMPLNHDPNGDFRCTSWSSTHNGGAHALLADGGVRFVTENLAWQIQRAVATRSGNEDNGDF